MEKVAAIDLGTNTFHLLIAKRDGSGFLEIVRERIWVSLAEEGIEKFSEKVLIRALDAIGKFRKILDEHHVKFCRTTGTEAFRSAINGPVLLDKIQLDYGIKVEIISGSREAELIYKGTSILFPGTNQPNVIMDIGGGSTEFIIYNKDGIIWSHSYKAGVTHLYNLFVSSDPLSSNDHSEIKEYFKKIFVNFPKDILKTEKCTLIGASGSFEVLDTFADNKPSSTRYSQFSPEDFYMVYREIYSTTLEERMSHPKIPDTRAKLIVVAFSLIDYMLDLIKPNKIMVSPYALKEGLIREMLQI
jgi:exopolyphosphatase/guanosine-5'-triphosphate,3'-diphosphate pyrophosphatase